MNTAIRVAELDRQLSEEHGELKKAQAAVAAASGLLAKEPTSRAHRARVVELRQQVAEIQAGIEALHDSREEAIRHDQSDEVKALRKARPVAADKAKGQYADCQDLAREVDRAFATLTESMAALKAQREAAKKAGFEYLELHESDPDTRHQHALMLISEPSALAHAISFGLLKVAQAAGVSLHDYVVFNHFTLSPSSGAVSVEAAARMNAERVAIVVREVEKFHG